jgi:hypothetical protein
MDQKIVPLIQWVDIYQILHFPVAACTGRAGAEASPARSGADAGCIYNLAMRAMQNRADIRGLRIVDHGTTQATSRRRWRTFAVSSRSWSRPSARSTR